MNSISRALKICVLAHKTQLDKAGELYSFHPIRVSLLLKTKKEKIVGLLHDVVEDTNWTVKKLSKEGFSADILDAIDAISRREGETVMRYYNRIKENELATIIKIADLTDNSSLERYDMLPQKKHTENRQIFYLTKIEELTKYAKEKFSG